ncbi:ABC transporter ATP-binding protein [Candidatus Bathyarchaeota archaeon ex4484_40]|nr:MAG: ABC transporter ATP-binding protein [Candidatus Bathyarchaeota archaeon ex4484_40]
MSCRRKTGHLDILRVENLNVEVSGRTVLKDVSFSIPEGEVHVLFGPNGSGKSTLIKTILGFPGYKVLSGSITFKGEEITDMPTDERVKLGIGVAFQNPPAVMGVKLGDLLKEMTRDGEEAERRISTLLKELNFPRNFLTRDVNLGFSGGEIKKSEILQVLAQDVDLMILDEPDSGVDVENLQVIGEVLSRRLKGKSALLITHLGYILRYVDADVAHVLIDGRIACSGSALKILGQILKEGYRWCEKCPRVKDLRCEGFP